MEWHVLAAGLELGHCLALWRPKCGSGAKMPFGYSCTILFLSSWLYVPIAFCLGVSPLRSFHPNLSAFCLLLTLSALPLPSAYGSYCLMAPASCLLFSAWLSASAPCCQLLITSPHQIKIPPKKSLMSWTSQDLLWAFRGFEKFWGW